MSIARRPARKNNTRKIEEAARAWYNFATISYPGKEGKRMNVLVIDGQGGGIGRALVEKLKSAVPSARVTAVGANATATAAMLRAGADLGATGESAIRYQCRHADVIAGVTGMVVTKLDGTAKGGVVIAVCNTLKIPVKFVGVGEQMDDLMQFDAHSFVEALI